MMMTIVNAKEDKGNWFIAQLFQAQPWLANCGSLGWPTVCEPSKTLNVVTGDWPLQILAEVHTVSP